MDTAHQNQTEIKPLYDGLLSVVVPCKDEEEMLPIFRDEFFKVVEAMAIPISK